MPNNVHYLKVNREKELGSSLKSRPGKGEVKIKICSISLNFHDSKLINTHSFGSPGKYIIDGCSGFIEEIGPCVKNFDIGDRVLLTINGEIKNSLYMDAMFKRKTVTDNILSKSVICQDSYPVHAPSGWSYTETATLPGAGTVAWCALFYEKAIHPKNDVLILGTGAVAVYTLQLASILGCKVWAIAQNQNQVLWLKQQGLFKVIDSRVYPNWSQYIIDQTHGSGIDRVIETGCEYTLEQSLQAVKKGGKLILAGKYNKVSGDNILKIIIDRQLTVESVKSISREQQVEVINIFEKMLLRPIIDSVYSSDSNIFHPHEVMGSICATL